MIRKKWYRCGQASGYRPANEFHYRIWNLILLFPVLVMALPVISIFYIVLLFTQGRPVFYKGVRLGKDKKPFEMYKFRTLVTGADKKTKTCVLPVRSGLETPLGNFFRDTRLDELPQLFNILKGEMNFIGPRPSRPAITEEVGCTIKNYDIRFSVKPGLIGYTQLFMTHRTPKKIRARFNNYFCRRRAIFWKEPFTLAMTVIGMIRKMASFLWRKLSCSPIGKAGDSEDILISDLINYEKKLSPSTKMMMVSMAGYRTKYNSLILDINHETFTFFSSVPLSEGENRFFLRHPKRRINACCFGKIVKKSVCSESLSMKAGSLAPRHFYLVYYKPASEFDFYKIDKYFLNNSILP
ncbi:sugar transferase [Desulfococcaceae bacterium HSG8]|nr:sugar transferase [Desulfococcaceae bacterium HSG8]